MAWGFKHKLTYYIRSIANSRSRSFFVALLFFIIGIAFGEVLSVRIDIWLFGLLCLQLVCILITKQRVRFIVVLLFLLTLGLFRYQQFSPLPNVPMTDAAIGHDIRISGTVDTEVIERMNSKEVVIDDVFIVDQPVEGRMQIWFPLSSDVKYSDEIVFHCVTKAPEPIESFRYDKLLLSRRIFATCSNPESIDIRSDSSSGLYTRLLKVKKTLVQQIKMMLPEPHASFVTGLIFGGSSSLDRDLRDSFSRTGTSHIMAASGYNVAIFSYILLLQFMRLFGKRRGLVLTVLFVFAYVFFAGATAPVVRATLMAILALIGSWFGRTQSTKNIFILAASLMLFFNPFLLFNDVGFQLSFVATWALVAFTPRIKEWFVFIPETFSLRESFAASLAAITCTLPILFWHFGTISLVAPFVNLLVLPFIPYLMFFGGVGMFVQFFSSSFALVFALPAWAMSYLVLHIVIWFGALDFSLLAISYSRIAAILSLVPIFFFMKYMKDKQL